LQKAQDELAARNKSLQKALEDAQQASRAKSEFLSNMSHELKTPLNAILGFSELAITSGLEPNLLKSMTAIRTSGRNLLDLINDLIDLSRLESGKIEFNSGILNIPEFMKKLEKEYSNRCAEKKLSFSCSWPEEPFEIRVDPTRLRQVFIQLLGNAIIYSAHGEVTFILKNCQSRKNESCDLEFLIEDTGMGMEPALKESINALFRNEASLDAPHGQGIGLGLALATRIVSKMGGELNVESTPEVGSVFSVKLKKLGVEQWTNPNNIEKIEPEHIIDRSGLVLIVDDSPLNIDLLKTMLSQNYNFTFLSAEDGAKAVELTKKNTPDLILMDINMPKMDGFTATREIKQNKQLEKCPVIFLSAYIGERERMKVRNVGSEFCLSKPIDMEKLFIMVDKILSKKEKNSELSEIHTILRENGYSHLAQKLARTLVMDDISHFADKIKINVGSDDSRVLEWANALKTYAADFDVVQIRKALEVL